MQLSHIERLVHELASCGWENDDGRSKERALIMAGVRAEIRNLKNIAEPLPELSQERGAPPEGSVGWHRHLVGCQILQAINKRNKFLGGYGLVDIVEASNQGFEAAMRLRLDNFEASVDTVQFDQYVKDAARTLSTKFQIPHEDIIHAIMGISTEAGEMLDQLKKHMFYGKDLDVVNLMEEVGDLMWYVAILSRAMGWRLEAVLAKNIAKLRARYPQKFETEQALNRDLALERQVLEGEQGTRAAEIATGRRTVLSGAVRCDQPGSQGQCANVEGDRGICRTTSSGPGVRGVDASHAGTDGAGANI